MNFEYIWKHKEANFGLPEAKQIPGGTHITLEIILKKDREFIALRRPKGIPEHELPPHASEHSEGLLYFCHNLIRYGESLEQCVERIVRDQARVAVKEFRVFYIDSSVQEKDNQWAIVPYVLAEVADIPSVSYEVTEVIRFAPDNIPDGFAWWTKEELKEELEALV